MAIALPLAALANETALRTLARGAPACLAVAEGVISPVERRHS